MKYKIVEGDVCDELHEFDEETQEYRKVDDTDFEPDEIDDAVSRYLDELDYQELAMLETYENYGDDDDRSFIG